MHQSFLQRFSLSSKEKCPAVFRYSKLFDAVYIATSLSHPSERGLQFPDLTHPLILELCITCYADFKWSFSISLYWAPGLADISQWQ